MDGIICLEVAWRLNVDWRRQIKRDSEVGSWIGVCWDTAKTNDLDRMVLFFFVMKRYLALNPMH